MASRPYFAYGSNLDLAQMARRCPASRPRGLARLEGWRWLIMSRGWATIIPDPASSVHGLLWELDATDEPALDRQEGVAHGSYTKEEVVVTEGRTGARVTALVYVATESRPGLPRPGYLELIVGAAKAHGMDGDWVRMLRAGAARRAGASRGRPGKRGGRTR